LSKLREGRDAKRPRSCGDEVARLTIIDGMGGGRGWYKLFCPWCHFLINESMGLLRHRKTFAVESNSVKLNRLVAGENAGRESRRLIYVQ